METNKSPNSQKPQSRKEEHFFKEHLLQEMISLPLHVIASEQGTAAQEISGQEKKELRKELFYVLSDSKAAQKEILLPRFLAEGGSDVYCFFDPRWQKWQLVVVNRHLVAKEGMQVLFFNHLQEEYAVIPFEELPSHLEKTDPAFRLRHADLEDMYIGVVLAVCQRENLPSSP